MDIKNLEKNSTATYWSSQPSRDPQAACSWVRTREWAVNRESGKKKAADAGTLTPPSAWGGGLTHKTGLLSLVFRDGGPDPPCLARTPSSAARRNYSERVRMCLHTMSATEGVLLLLQGHSNIC